MEKFKAVEKEMKTKAYSKEGLSAAAKLDPKEKEKLEVCDFLSSMVEELERQIETTEAEAEALQANMKKGKKDTGKADRVAELERNTERHKWHQAKLEQLLRALENGGVETDQVKDIEESIKYYVENNQEVDFMEDDSIYDDFALEAEDDPFGMNDADKVSSQDAQSVQDEPPEQEDKARSGSVSVAKPKPSTMAPELPAAQGRRPSLQLKSPLPALATLHTSLPANVNGSAPPGMKPAPLPTIPTGQTLKYASAAAAAAASDRSGVGIAPLPPPPGITANSSTLPSSGPSRNSTSTSPSAQPSVPATVDPSPQQPPPPKPAKIAEPVEQSPAPVVAQPVETKVVEQPLPQVHREIAPPPGLSRTPVQKDTILTVTNGETSKAKTLESEEPESIFHLPSSLQDVLESFQATVSRTSTLQPPDERMLATSRAACPSPLDSEKPNHYKAQSPYPYTPTHYPQEPLGIFNDARLYNRIDTDTLFYAFYYRQGTYQQYLAAKALKSQSWRFHKQYQTWFQRHEEPKNITEEYEQGTYRFFDYESTWYVDHSGHVLIPH